MIIIIQKSLLTKKSQDKIYTNVGGVLISVNPYKFIPYLYSLKSPGEAPAVSNITSPGGHSHKKANHDGSAASSGSHNHGEEEELQTGPHVYLIAQQAIEAVEQSKVMILIHEKYIK
jgi:myosin heavy subunit